MAEVEAMRAKLRDLDLDDTGDRPALIARLAEDKIRKKKGMGSRTR